MNYSLLAAQAGKSGNGALIAVIVFFIVLISGMLIFAFMLKRKMDAEQQGEGAVSGGKEDTAVSNGKLQDTKRLVGGVERIEDGIVVTDNGTRFIAAITCRGIDFYNENMNEQLSVLRAYQGFLNLMEKPMTYRLYSKAVDIDSPMERYERRLEEVVEAYEQADKTLRIAKERDMTEEVERLIPVVNLLAHRMEHLKEQIEIMAFYSSTDVVMDVTQDYIFDWTYRETDVKLKKGEIFAKAKKELSTIATQKIDALLATGVKARMCTNDEMVDMFRRQSKPYGAETFKQKYVSSSSIEEDVVSSESEELWREAAIAEDVYHMDREFDEEEAIEFLKQKIMEEEGDTDEN